MVEKFETPLQLTVTIPQSRPQQFGVHSVSFPGSTRPTIRLNAEDSALIKKWSDLLLIDASTFLRECAVNTAKELERLHNAHLKSLRSG